MLKRTLCIALALLMTLSFAACSGDKKDDKKPSKTETTAVSKEDTTTVYYEPDDLDESLDFGGETVTFFTPADSLDGWFEGEITVEELTNEVINDSVYNRELDVEERLNVQIENVPNDEDYKVIVNRMINSGDDNYQILAQRALELSTFGVNGYLYDLYDIDNLDLDKPWWSEKFNEKAEIFGHLFLTTGSLSLTLERFLFVTFYNKKVAEDNSDTIPELADLYTLVEEGKWTIDKFMELGGGIYTDANGNSQADAEDYFGIGMNRGIDIDMMWSSFDINVFSKDDDGFFKLDVDTEKLYSACEKINTLLYKTKGCFTHDTPSDGNLAELEVMFAGDSLLFCIDRMFGAETETLRNMQHDYGILPTPKYDENQKEYYSYAHDQYTAFAIPVTCANTKAAGAVLEAMASYSYRNTSPAYLDLALKGKYMNDMQSRRMIDIIVNGFKVDTVWIYIHSIGYEFTTTFRQTLAYGETNYSSTYATLEKKLGKTIPVDKREIGARLGDN